MVSSCKGICQKYKSSNMIHSSYYQSGSKRCSHCMLYINWEGLRCPCCGKTLRTHPKSKRNVSKLDNGFSAIDDRARSQIHIHREYLLQQRVSYCWIASQSLYQKLSTQRLGEEEGTEPVSRLDKGHDFQEIEREVVKRRYVPHIHHRGEQDL